LHGLYRSLRSKDSPFYAPLYPREALECSRVELLTKSPREFRGGNRSRLFPSCRVPLFIYLNLSGGSPQFQLCSQSREDALILEKAPPSLSLGSRKIAEHVGVLRHRNLTDARASTCDVSRRSDAQIFIP